MFYERDGARMYYETHQGESGQRPVLLLHGWGGSTQSWLPLLRDLRDSRTVCAVDFLGHGQSGEPPTPWSVTEYAAFLYAFLRDERLTPVDVVAHSFGGRVALLLAAEHPECVGRLVLTGCAGLKPQKTARGRMRSAAYRALRRLLDSALARVLCSEACRNRGKERLVQRFGSADYKALNPAMRATFNRVIAQDLHGCLARIQAPTVLFWGARDSATPLWMAKTMEREIADVGLIVMEDCGHFAYLDRYAEFLAVVRSFLGASGESGKDGGI